MAKNKFWVLLIILISTGGFFAFRKVGGLPGSPVSQKQRILLAVSQLLEEQHYSPKKINDDFSKLVFYKTLDEMDGDKNLFLESDIASLKKYETTIDDEIHGNSEIEFMPALNAIYDKRIPEVITLYNQLLSSPFDFNKDEQYVAETEKTKYPANEAARKERWRKKMKLLTLERFVDLQDQRAKSKVDSIAHKSDSTLEAEARTAVLKVMKRTYDRINAKFKEDERFNMFINVVTNLMDPHTDFFPPVEKRDFDEKMSGRFYGIGAQLSEQEGQIKIASLIPGGPAFKSGELMVNDYIIKVGQGGTSEMVDITGFAVEDAVKLIRGTKNTEVRLTIKKSDGTTKTISLIRDEIVQDESFAKSFVIQDGNKKIGFIYLPEFYADFERPNGAKCSQDVEKEIIKLKAENIDGMIVDLRFNGGGALHEVTKIAGFFVGHGPVVQAKDKDGSINILDDDNSHLLYDGPLAVMVNELSASASEIFAAAIQDYKRGIIVGSTSTYGKGTVQRNIPVGKTLDFFSGKSEFGALKLTFQKFYRVNGGSTQLKGVIPDVILPDAYETYKFREKDNTSALPYDEITKAPINAFPGYDSAISIARKEVKANNALTILQNNTKWLGKISDAPIELKIDKYKAQLKAQRATINQDNSLTKLTKDLDIHVLAPDKDKYYNNPDKAKGERYQAWLKTQKNDMYIGETVKIVNDIIKTSTNNSNAIH